MRRTTTIGLDLPAMLGLPEAADLRAMAGRLHVALTFATAPRIEARRVFENGLQAYADDDAGALAMILSLGPRGGEDGGELASCAWAPEGSDGKIGPCVELVTARA